MIDYKNPLNSVQKFNNLFKEHILIHRIPDRLLARFPFFLKQELKRSLKIDRAKKLYKL
tara:strand:- start:2000 stop:2176 length:177 start_codon:yes stop_codon:yes gene_type:complete